jgi:predicted Rossmann fold flavoprotein
LPPRLAIVILKLSEINPIKQVNSVSREERKKLVGLLKGFDLEIIGLVGFDRAMVTSGGVKLSEVDPKTMKSKLIDNLYLAGEILDLDGPTGGYNLQVCWSTGHRAGESVAVV